MLGQWGDECVALHRVMIHDRGGISRVFQVVDVTSVTWGRLLDGVSGAEVVISGNACAEQADRIDNLARGVGRYELVLFRGDVRVWEGPIVQVATTASAAVITAHDIKEYLDRTPLSKDWKTTARKYPMTSRIAAMIDYELTTPYSARVGTGSSAAVVSIPRWENIEPPANIFPYVDVRASSTLYTRAATLAFEMMLGEHLNALADGNLNYTVVGRSLVIWDSSLGIGRTRKLTENDFEGELTVISAGTEHADVAHISATRPDKVPPPSPGVVAGVGNAGGVHDYYGVWTIIASDDQEEGDDDPTQDELNSQARRTLAGRIPVPTEIRSPGGIRLSHDLTINDLVPGVIMPVLADLNIRRVSQDQQLTAMTVTETPDGETIAVTLISAGDITVIAATEPEEAIA